MNSFQIIQEQKKMLGNLDRWLGQAVEYAVLAARAINWAAPQEIRRRL